MIGALGALSGLGAVLWHESSDIIRWRIHKTYPDVDVRGAELGWKVVYLRGISFDRHWIRGTVDRATVTWDRAVDIEGGHVDVRWDEKPSHGAADAATHSQAIRFRNLTVEVTRGSITVDLQGVASSDASVCWLTGSATHPRGTVSFLTGCAARDGSYANVDEATLKAIDVPHVPPGSELTLVGVTSDGKTVSVNQAHGVMELMASEHAAFDASNMRISIQTGEGKPTITADSIKIQHPWIAHDPVTFRDIKAEPDEPWWHVTIDDASFDVNPEGLAAHGRAGQSCQTWVNALPEELRVEPLRSLSFDGDFTWAIDLKAKGPDGKPKPIIDFASCRVPKTSCDPIRALKKPFTYSVYTPDGELTQRTSGPHTPGWLPLAATGRMQFAVMNYEDPGFRKHRGFIQGAYFGALSADLTTGKFLRGGSTITMQLAKNLWLRRSKTLGRKVQELFLSMALESCLSKDEIMELYLNVVEFGPRAYGIQAGAEHWFHRPPTELDPVQAFWLASILPNPHKPGLAPTPEALERASKFMKQLADLGRDIGDSPLDNPEWDNAHAPD